MSNALFAPGIELAKSWATQRDAAHERVIASRKNSPEKLVAEIRTDEATTDEKVKAWQEREEKVMAALNAEREKINAYIRENLVKVNSDYDETADVETVKELNGKIVAMRKYMEGVGATEEDFADFPESKSLRGAGKGGSGGTGAKRPRLSSIEYSLDHGKTYVDAAPGEDDPTTFSALAGVLRGVTGHKVEVKDLQAAIFQEAGTDDLSTKQGQDFSASVVVGEQNVFIRVGVRVQDDAA